MSDCGAHRHAEGVICPETQEWPDLQAEIAAAWGSAWAGDDEGAGVRTMWLACMISFAGGLGIGALMMRRYLWSRLWAQWPWW